MAPVAFRGKRADRRSIAMIEEAERLGGPLVLTQGAYSTSVGASAGTHSGGGAFDFSVRGLSTAQINRRVRALRRVGFAAWHRVPAEGPWPAHIHAVAVGCDDLAPVAARQVESLRRGRSGLASNGPDRHRDLRLPVTTWEAYKKRRDQAEDDDREPTGWKAYRVRSGDTLSAIAARFDTSVRKLVARNKLRDPDSLAVGQRLEVPR